MIMCLTFTIKLTFICKSTRLCHKPHSPASVQLFANDSSSVMVDYNSQVKLTMHLFFDLITLKCHVQTLFPIMIVVIMLCNYTGQIQKMETKINDRIEETHCDFQNGESLCGDREIKIQSVVNIALLLKQTSADNK